MSHLSAEIRSKNNWWNIYQDQEWQEKQLKQATESIWPIDAPCGRMEVILNPSQVRNRTIISLQCSITPPLHRSSMCWMSLEATQNLEMLMPVGRYSGSCATRLLRSRSVARFLASNAYGNQILCSHPNYLTFSALNSIFFVMSNNSPQAQLHMT